MIEGSNVISAFQVVTALLMLYSPHVHHIGQNAGNMKGDFVRDVVRTEAKCLMTCEGILRGRQGYRHSIREV